MAQALMALHAFKNSLTNFREFTDDAALMALNLFPRDKYLNIWVVNKKMGFHEQTIN